MTPATPPDAPTPSAEDKFKAPAQKPGRSPNDMLPPAAATPEAPGSTGLAAEVPSLPATHRTAPVDQASRAVRALHATGAGRPRLKEASDRALLREPRAEPREPMIRVSRAPAALPCRAP